MHYRLRSLTTSLLLLAVLPLACAKKESGKDSASGGNAGGTGVSLNGGGNGGASSTDTGPTAADTTDGTIGIDATQAASLLADPAANCKGWSVEAEAQPVVVEFVIDVSDSMAKPAPSTGGFSKWEVTRTALKNAIAKFPPSFGVGVTFFPNMAVSAGTDPRPVSACVNTANDVALDNATTDQIAKVQGAIDAITINPQGATPTHDAYNIAVEQMRKTTLLGNKYIVLITDGQPTQSLGCIGTGSVCTPLLPAPIIDAITQAQTADSISTFIVGSPGSERNVCTGADVRSWLSQAARAGNTATASCDDKGPTYCHFDLSQTDDFGKSLSAALFAITKSLLSCQYDVPAPPSGQTIDPAKINMIYQDGSGGYFLILPDKGGTCDKGWSFTDASRAKVQICGTSCDLFTNNPQASLAILFGCTQDTPIPLQ